MTMRRMERSVGVGALVLFVPLLFWVACVVLAENDLNTIKPDNILKDISAKPPMRIVSLVPSLTETLFVLGLGDRLVGITDFCEHLPAARTIPSIGTCLEPSIEAIAAKHPDLVLCGSDQQSLARRLAGLGIETVQIHQIALDDIPLAIRRIGEMCGVPDAAASAAARFQSRLDAVAETVRNRPRPRVLLAVGRDVSGGRIEQAYVAAPGAYHDELLRLAGAENAWRGKALTAYPVVTQEGLMSLNPDVVIDLVPDPDRQPGGIEGLKAAWAAVPGMTAVASGQVALLTEPHLSIPGPDSAAEAAERLARLIHPEANWHPAETRPMP
ncbi:MAG TPA: helical backbone metal receptor [Candidatus Ozemobacteraceae bacterium]|nr:helical backbone metal receptor [Candidatus Ozemobacteraceae bacterium]